MSVRTHKVAAIEQSAFLASFETFYAKELNSVVGLAYVLSGSKSAAEDLAQDGFLAAYRNWEKVVSLDDPGAWVRRVVSNNAVSAFRRRTAEVRALLRVRQPNVTVDEVPHDSEKIWEEVRRLPRRQAQVIALRYLDHQSLTQIAEILGCSENTVKTHLLRAKQTLSQRLEREFQI